MWTDLHVHSAYSDDGELTPAELVLEAVRAGLEAMSLTDHNCARANREAERLASERGISYVSGIEVDCTLDGVDFHVLGYGMDPESADLARIERDVAAQAEGVSRKRLARLAEMGLGLDESDLPPLSEGEWTGEKLAEALLGKPEHAEDPRLEPYRPGGARADRPLVNFYWDFCSQGAPAYAPMRYPAMKDVVELIHANGGLAVLAHPGANLHGDRDLLERAIVLGLDGIEAYTSYHSPDEAQRYTEAARSHGLFVTCGSDFHGKTKPDVRLGGHGAPEGLEVPDALAALMRQA